MSIPSDNTSDHPITILRESADLFDPRIGFHILDSLREDRDLGAIKGKIQTVTQDVWQNYHSLSQRTNPTENPKCYSIVTIPFSNEEEGISQNYEVTFLLPARDEAAVRESFAILFGDDYKKIEEELTVYQGLLAKAKRIGNFIADAGFKQEIYLEDLENIYKNSANKNPSHVYSTIKQKHSSKTSAIESLSMPILTWIATQNAINARKDSAEKTQPIVDKILEVKQKIIEIAVRQLGTNPPKNFSELFDKVDAEHTLENQSKSSSTIESSSGVSGSAERSPTPSLSSWEQLG